VGWRREAVLHPFRKAFARALAVVSRIGRPPARRATGVAPGPRLRHNGVSEPSSREASIIPKRKPPSSRPERQLDETARAIANDLEEARAAKSTGSGPPPPPGSKRQVGPADKVTARRTGIGPTPTTSTKRPKTGSG